MVGAQTIRAGSRINSLSRGAGESQGGGLLVERTSTDPYDPAMNLLAADEASPVRVLRETGSSAFVLTADHAGRAIPRRLGQLGLPDSELVRHIAWDIGIAGVTE